MVLNLYNKKYVYVLVEIKTSFHFSFFF